MKGFLQCDHDVGLDILALLRRFLVAAESAPSSTAACPAEHLLEKVAEPGAVKLKLALGRATVAAGKTTTG